MRRLIPLLFAAAIATPLYAQEEVELILEDRRSNIQTNIRRQAEQKKEETPAVVAAPTPAPEDVIVAIVNSRVLTRAEMAARVTSRYEDVKNQVLSTVGGVVATIDPAAPAVNPIEDQLEDELVLEEQRVMIERAMLLEEETALQSWVEHSLLAEEARRQGIIISDTVFRSRLDQAERENRLSRTDIDSILTEMRMTRADYERSVYDALMIEQLLERFIKLNYTEDQLREAYQKRPDLYYEPEKFLIAHFTIALDGREGRDRIRELRELAREVRTKLQAGADPEALFEEDRYDRFPEGIFGAVPGYFTFREGSLPRIVETKAREMKVGETSDVLVAQIREGKDIIPVSMHVVKILEKQEATGQTFESALPAIHRAMLEVARMRLLNELRNTGTHRVVTNLSGVPPRLIPTREQLIQAEAKAQPINLKLAPRS